MIRLTLLLDSPIPLEFPTMPATQTPAEIERLTVHHGNRSGPLAEFFRVESVAEPDNDLEIVGDCSRVQGIGRGWAGGRLLVRGSAGMHVGAAMTGGEILIDGDAGAWLGAEMRGGRIRVNGLAGDCVGAAYRGGPLGMRGGEIAIRGSAGAEVGACLRRGLIAIGGDCGDYAGISMIAGTIVVGGRIGARAGAGIKRGSLIALRTAFDLPPTWRYDCDSSPVYMRLLLRRLAELGIPVDDIPPDGPWRRYSGDHLAFGKGEAIMKVG